MMKSRKFQTNGELFTADPPQDGSATIFKAEAPRTLRKENRSK
jgi:hypothetical protein